MKKIIILIFAIFMFVSSATISNAQEIQFIYINGSNNNDDKMKNWFFEGIDKTHKNMYNAFYKSPFTVKHFLDNGRSKIAKEPEIFFWGDMSSNEINSINSELSITKLFSPKLAQTVRSLLAHCLHDAIWVSHYRNMHPVLQNLHSQVMENYQNNKQVVLFGYSAGAFVTYEYMFNKFPYINAEDFFSRGNLPQDFKQLLKTHKQKNTCIDALIKSNLAISSADGQLVLNVYAPDTNKNFKKLNDYTCKYCTPDNSLKGIVNFASPLVLFYSDISNPNYPFTYYNKLLYKYLLENNIFWLTVNYAEDPLGYPTSKNLSYFDLKDRLNIEITPNKGFIYSKSDVKSRKTFIGAHTSYWATSKKFAKAVAKAYEQGFILYNLNFYEE